MSLAQIEAQVIGDESPLVYAIAKQAELLRRRDEINRRVRLNQRRIEKMALQQSEQSNEKRNP